MYRSAMENLLRQKETKFKDALTEPFVMGIV